MKIRKTAFIWILSLLLGASICMTPLFQIHTEAAYIYSQDGEDTVIPDAYQYLYSIHLKDAAGISANTPQDMTVDKNGILYVIDTQNNRVLLSDTKGKAVKSISSFQMPDGSETQLNKPEGIQMHHNGHLLIADTQNNRILETDTAGKVIKVIAKPKNMLGIKEEDAFFPIKVDVDDLGRLFIVARNYNQGMICTDGDGQFIGFVGAPRVQPDIWEIFWRRFSTKAQLAKMQQYVSTEYNNVLVDDKNFIWGTISSLDAGELKNTIQSKDKSGKVTPISKINAGDIDVLKRNGVYPPVGDLIFTQKQSMIVDVAVSDGGIYTLLDFQRGRLFTYDDNGNLLFAFGDKGEKRENFKQPVAVLYQNDKLFILDAELAEILVYEPTGYGQDVIRAVRAQYEGDYEESYRLWAEVANKNANFEYAFVGMGNVSISEKKYEQAMEYFKYANNVEKYSEAFELLRKEKLEHSFGYLFLAVIVLIIGAIILYFVKKIRRYVKGEGMEK